MKQTRSYYDYDQSIWKNRKYVRPPCALVVALTPMASNFLAEFFNGDQFFKSEKLMFLDGSMCTGTGCTRIDGPDIHVLALYSWTVLSKTARAAVGQAQAIWLLSDKFDREAADEADSLMTLRCLQLHVMLKNLLKPHLCICNWLCHK